jgi:hypothetical protein
MNLNRIKMVSAVVAAVAVAGAVGYQGARWAHAPKLLEVAEAACGVPPATAAFAFPLEGALRSSGSLPIAVGPIDMPGGGGLITLRFDPTVDGGARDVRMIEDVIYLPTGYGRDAQIPDRITITCRDGGIASVRYRNDRRGGATFNVLREQAAAMISDASEPSGDAAEDAAPVTMSD